MPSRVRAITIDSHDPVALARFWSEVTGRPMDSEGDDAWVDITDDPDSIVPDLLFIRVSEGKAAEVRVEVS
jgi:Glyoxalase-like domain